MLLLASCSGLELSEQEKIRRANAHKEVIYRQSSDKTYELSMPQMRQREHYPWEDGAGSSIAKITKDAFRCRGSSINHAQPKDIDPSTLLYDCEGVLKHSLPVRSGKEFIFPILLDLLNHVQLKTSHKVIITCGHRCPAHNTYADQSAFNQSSKHMIGAEVDFYVEGMENQPEKIAAIIMEYFSLVQPYVGSKEYTTFHRLEAHLTNVSTPPWYNKEALIKIYQKNEARDLDNRHSFPYLCLQVRHDRDLNEKVTYSWDKAFKGFLRY